MPYYYGYGYGYYSQEYFWFLGAILLCMLFSGIASYKVKSSFAFVHITHRTAFKSCSFAEIFNHSKSPPKMRKGQSA